MAVEKSSALGIGVLSLLGGAIISRFVRAAISGHETPFLHVFPDNAVFHLYARLGFLERAQLWVLCHRPESP